MKWDSPRVIHVVQRDDAAAGGAVRVAFELVRRLAPQGIDARILFLYGKCGPFGRSQPHLCDYLRIGSSSRLHQLGRFRSYLRRMRPAIVHFHDDLLWPQLLSCFLRPWATVIHAHGGGAPSPQSWKTKLMYSCQRRHAAMVVCITKEARQSQLNNVGFSAERMRVIANGVDRDAFPLSAGNAGRGARERLGLPPDGYIVSFVGRLDDQMKGCLDFVDLVKRLPMKYVGLVAGSGPDEAIMRQRARRLGIAKRIIFLGLVEDVSAVYRATDVFCFMSRYEPFGLTIAEAMSSGVPVVGFRCPGGSGEILTNDTGCVIDGRDLGAMAMEVEIAASRRGDWPSRIAKSLEVLDQQFDWDNSARELAKLYREVVDDR